MRLYIKLPGSKKIEFIEIDVLSENSIRVTIDPSQCSDEFRDYLQVIFPLEESELVASGKQYIGTIDNTSFQDMLERLDLLIGAGAGVSEKEAKNSSQALALKELKDWQRRVSEKIKLENKDQVPPRKHKQYERCDSTQKQQVCGSHSHTNTCVMPDKKNGKNYVVKHEYDPAMNEASAFASAVAALAVGSAHVAKLSCLNDEYTVSRGVRSKEIKDFKSLRNLAETNKLPSQKELIEAGLVEALAYAYLIEDPDMHPNNLCIDENGKIVLFDFDRTMSSIICENIGFDPNDPMVVNGENYPPPAIMFPITEKDLTKFPNIEDAKPVWWLPKEMKGEINPLAKHLAGLENNPEVRYRAYKVFLRMCLVDKSVYEEFAKAHVQKEEDRKKYVDFMVKRVADLRAKLFHLDEFKEFLAQNPHGEIIAELEEYNKSLKDKEKNACFRVDIDKVKQQLKEHDASNDAIEKVKEQLQKDYKAVSDSVENVKKYLANDTSQNYQAQISEFSEDLIKIKGKIDEFPGNKLSLFAIRKALAELSRKIAPSVEEEKKKVAEQLRMEREREEAIKKIKEQLQEDWKIVNTYAANVQVHLGKTSTQFSSEQIRTFLNDSELIKKCIDKFPTKDFSSDGIEIQTILADLKLRISLFIIERFADVREKLIEITDFYKFHPNKQKSATFNQQIQLAQTLKVKIDREKESGMVYARSIHDLALIEQATERESEVILNDQTFFIRARFQPDQTPTEKLILNIRAILDTGQNELKSSSTGSFFVTPHFKWHLNNTSERLKGLEEDYLKKSTELRDISLERSNVFNCKHEVVKAIKKYFDGNKEKLPFYRLVNIDSIIKILKQEEVGLTLTKLQEKLDAYLDGIKTGFFGRSKLRDVIKAAMKNYTVSIASNPQPSRRCCFF